MNTIIFLGPTLSIAEAEGLLPASYRPPVAQGDVWRAAQERPRAIGIIDGFFSSVPAVWHKEILWAMSQGIKVFGSSSMGALRAAELAPLGMIGVGQVFDWFATSALEDDDEVALVHADASENYRPLSEPLVNIRATLSLAQAQNVAQKPLCDALVRFAKMQFYPERSWEGLFRMAKLDGFSPSEIGKIKEWVEQHYVDIKRQDAALLLQKIRAELESEDSPTIMRFEETSLWRTLIATDGHEDGLDAVIDEMKLDVEFYQQTKAARYARWHHLQLREELLDEARRQGIYKRFVRRAELKNSVVPQSTSAQLTAENVGLSFEQLFNWFFQTRLKGWPEDLNAFLRERNWTDEATLERIALREYLFEQHTGSIDFVSEGSILTDIGSGVALE